MGVQDRHMTPALTSPLAVVAHDAGAAELMLPWIDPAQHAVRALLEGPALALWRQRFGSHGLVGSMAEVLHGAQLLLSGTSLGADLEHRARLVAQARGVPSVAVIDHWTHYAARFQRDGQRVMADELWVCDAEAYALARATFPVQRVALRPNSWLLEQVRRMAPCPDPMRWQTMLLLSEPVGPAWGGDRPGEEQAFDFLVAHADRLGLAAPLSLRIRPHADEPEGRWRRWIDHHRGAHDIALDRSAGLAEALDGVAWVGGLESTALVLAHATGRRAVCLQPPSAPRSRLPQRGLIHLRDLLVPGATA